MIIGIGNVYRSDDAIGISIARRLNQISDKTFSVIEQSGEGTALMDSWREYETVFVIDAVCSGSQAGTIFRIDATNQSVPKRFFNYSTHAFSLAEAVELARVLQQLPHRLTIYGIEGKNFSAGTEISPEIKTASDELIQKLISEIKQGS